MRSLRTSRASSSKAAPYASSARTTHYRPLARKEPGGISNTTFYELVKAGDLPTIKMGRRTFVATSALDASSNDSVRSSQTGQDLWP